MDKIFLDEHRCACNKLLFKGSLFDGVLEIKCTRCGKINKIGGLKLLNGVRSYSLVTDNIIHDSEQKIQE